MQNKQYDSGKPVSLPVSLSKEKYGMELASKIADILEKGCMPVPSRGVQGGAAKDGRRQTLTEGSPSHKLEG